MHRGPPFRDTVPFRSQTEATLCVISFSFSFADLLAPLLVTRRPLFTRCRLFPSRITSSRRRIVSPLALCLIASPLVRRLIASPLALCLVGSPLAHRLVTSPCTSSRSVTPSALLCHIPPRMSSRHVTSGAPGESPNCIPSLRPLRVALSRPPPACLVTPPLVSHLIVSPRRVPLRVVTSPLTPCESPDRVPSSCPLARCLVTSPLACRLVMAPW